MLQDSSKTIALSLIILRVHFLYCITLMTDNQ